MKYILLLILFSLSLMAQFTPPTADRQTVTTDATGDLVSPSNFFTENSAEISALSPVQSVAGKSGAVTLTSADVGLPSVDDTSDADKPISIATQAAFDAAAAAVATTVSQVSAFSQRGIRSVGQVAALSMPSKDFGLVDHTVRAVVKRPHTESVVWSNQLVDYTYASVQDEILRKLGGTIVISGASSTGITWDTGTGACLSDDDALDNIFIGTVIDVSFDLDDGAAAGSWGFRSNSDSFSSWKSNTVSPVTGANSHTFIMTGSGDNFALYISAAGGTGGTVSNFTMTIRSALGERLIWQGDGRLRYQMGNVSNWTTHEWTSDITANVAVGDFAEIVATVDRVADELIFYVNGRQMVDSLVANEYHDISAAAAQSVSTGAGWRLLSDGSTHYAGSLVESFCLDTEVINASTVAERFADPTLWIDVAAPSVTIGNWDWSVGLDGWTATRSTATTGQAVAGESGWVKVVPNTESNNHTLNEAALPVVAESGDVISFSCKAYVPTDQAQNLNQLKFSVFNSAGSSQQSISTQTVTAGTVLTFQTTETLIQEAGKAYLWIRKDSADSYVGDDSSAMYIKDAQLSINGITRAVDLRASGATKPDRIGSDDGTYVTSSGVNDTDPLTLN